jgi:hypothetical protein
LPRLFDIRINTSEREGKTVYRVIVYPTGFKGREVPYYDYLGEDGYDLASDEFGWTDVERYAIHCELMANGGMVHIVRCALNETVAEHFGWPLTQ